MEDKTQSTKRYDLEDRTLKFARRIKDFVKKFPKSITNAEISDQLFRAAGSVGANYIEANEALSKKDFKMRIKICRKEAKESTHWLRLVVETNNESFQNEGKDLIKEATELKKIFSSIIEKSK